MPCGDRPSRGLKDEQWPPLQPSPAVRSTIPPGHRARLHGGEKRHTRTRVLLRLDFRFVQSDCPDGHLSLVVNSSNPPLSPCPRRGHSGNCPCRGIGPGRAKEARPCDGSQNEFNWGVKICQVDMDAPATSRWPAKWRRPHYCAVAAELIFGNITKSELPSCW